MSETGLTILSSMAGSDFEQALDQHVEWGIDIVDLKGGIFGKGIIDLTDDEALQAQDSLSSRALGVHCLSTNLFDAAAESGEETFQRDHLDKVSRAIDIARILKPKFIRLIAAHTERRSVIADAVAFAIDGHPWLMPMYQEAVDRIAKAGFCPTIENEVGGCILSRPDEVLAFFEALDRTAASFTWDVQNMWQMGSAPTLSVYKSLKDLIGYYHVKGGRAEVEEGALCWSTALKDASWPVLDITRRVIVDGVSPVICLNASHGRQMPGYNYENVVERDIDFLREGIEEIA